MQLKKMFKKRGQQGLSLIEASMVLALSAVVVSGAVMYYQGASDSNKLQDAMGELGSIQSAVQSLAASSGDYSAVTNGQLAKSTQIAPTFINKTSNGLVSPWKGAVTYDGTAASTYDVKMAGVPESACQTFALTKLGSSLVSLKVGSASGTPGSAALTTACDGGSDITWTFK
jgi:type II secretory pathway pseudopilin PulG